MQGAKGEIVNAVATPNIRMFTYETVHCSLICLLSRSSDYFLYLFKDMSTRDMSTF